MHRVQGSAEPNRKPQRGDKASKACQGHFKGKLWGEKVSSSSLFMGYREGLKLRLGWSVTEGSESHAKGGGALEVT